MTFLPRCFRMVTTSRTIDGVLLGSGALRTGGRALVIGIADRTAVGVDEAIRLASYVLTSIEDGSGPILVIVDSDSQRMSKRDELLGLNEYLAHLAKSPDLRGHPRPAHHRPAVRPLGCRGFPRNGVGDPGAGGIAGRRSRGDGSAVDGQGDEAVDRSAGGKGQVDAGVCPSLANLAQTGAVHLIWDEAVPLVDQLEAVLRDIPRRARPARCARQGARRPVEGA